MLLHMTEIRDTINNRYPCEIRNDINYNLLKTFPYNKGIAVFERQKQQIILKI